MASVPIFLTADEASSLKAAVESIVSTGIQVPVTEHQIPAAKAGNDGIEVVGTTGKPEVPPEGVL